RTSVRSARYVNDRSRHARDPAHSSLAGVLFKWRDFRWAGGNVSALREDKHSGKRNASVRFIEQFLAQPHGNKLVGLLLGQIDAFNRIVTTFGHDECEKFCARHAEKLRTMLPARTPIIRLAERRFAVLLAADSMTAIMDAAVGITEQNSSQLEIAGDSFLV